MTRIEFRVDHIYTIIKSISTSSYSTVYVSMTCFGFVDVFDISHHNRYEDMIYKLSHAIHIQLLVQFRISSEGRCCRRQVGLPLDELYVL